MPDENKTEIQANLNVTSEGVDKVAEQLGKLSTSLDEIAKKVVDVSEKFEKLGKNANIKIDSHDVNIPKKRSRLAYGKFDYTYASRSSFDRVNANILSQRINEQLKLEEEKLRENNRLLTERAKLLEKDNANYKQILDNKTRDSKTRARNAKTNAQVAQNTKKRTELNEGWLKYRAAHPELFTRQQGQASYELGNFLLTGGNHVLKSGLLGGSVLGSGMEITGAFIKNGQFAMFGTALGLAVKNVTDFAKATKEAYSQIEAVKTQLSVVMGSDVQSGMMYEEIAKYAVKSPFGIEQTSELAILLKQSGVYATDLMNTLKMLGDTAGGNMEKMKRIANNYAQIVSIGKASMLDMRQFAYAGIPIFEAVSKELGVSQAQLRKLISDGKVTSNIIEKVFKDLTGINGIFQNATSKGAETLKARLQNLEDIKQTSLAQAGEFAFNFGKTYNRDSYSSRSISLLEKMYDSVKNVFLLQNIQRDVNNIATRDDALTRLKALRSQAKEDGDKNLVEYYDRQIKEILKTRDIEKERASLNAAYINYTEYNKKVDALERAYGTSNPILKGINGAVGIGYELSKGVYKLVRPVSTGTSLAQSAMGEVASVTSGQPLIVVDATIENIKDSSGKISEYWSLMTMNTKTISDKMILASKQVATELSQQKGYDYINKAAGRNDSGASISSEIRQLVEKLPENEKKQQDKLMALYKQTIDDAKKIFLTQNSNGVIDFSKINVNDLLKFAEKGYFTGEKLAVTENKSLAQMKEDKRIIAEQSLQANKFSEELFQGLLKDFSLNPSMLKYVQKLQLKLDNMYFDPIANFRMDDTEYLNKFDEAFSDRMTFLDSELAKAISLGEKEKINVLKQVQLLFSLSTLRLSANTDIKDTDVNDLRDLKDKKSSVNIPLWKRLLGNATGISPNVINSTKDTLEAYRDDMAVRNTAKNVFSTILQNGGNVKDIQKLLGVSGERKEFSDGSKTFQIDWKKTSKNLEEFSLRLSASTKIVDAYKTGLESQLKTYEDLLANAVTASETTDINGIKTKTVSASKWGELTKDQGDQLVNAFGEKIKTISGEEVSYIKDGIAYDKQGNKLQEQQVILTGNLFEWLETELPKLRDSIKEAKKQSDINSLLGEFTENLGKQDIFQKLLLKATPEQARYIIGNRDSVIKNVLENIDFSGSTIKNYNDLFAIQQGKFGENSQYVEVDADDILNKATELFFENLAEASKSPSTWYNYENYSKKESALDIYSKSTVPAVGDKGLWGNIKDSFASYSFLGKLLSNQGLDIKSWDEAVSIKAQDENLRKQVEADNPNADKIKELPKLYEEAADKAMKLALANKEIGAAISNAAVQMTDLSKAVGGQLLTSTFSSLGKALVTGASASEDMEENLRNACSQMVSGIGAAMTTAGFQIAGAAAASQQWGMVAAGLGLAAAGGFTSGIGGALSSVSSADPKEFEYNANDQYEKLESLKDQLVQILEQAQSDAQYYETTLRHKQAVGTTGNISATSVHDALIDTNGKIITTDPKDYLIATKNPKQLVGGGNVTVQPQITIMPVNNSRADVNVRTEQNINSDGSVEVIAYIEDAVGNYIASSRSDDAFNARQFRINGHQSVM